jgi:hypothetical protein
MPAEVITSPVDFRTWNVVFYKKGRNSQWHVLWPENEREARFRATTLARTCYAVRWINGKMIQEWGPHDMPKEEDLNAEND